MRPVLASCVLPVAVAVAALIAACDQPQNKIPTGPAIPGVKSLAIVGPASIAPGQSVQLGTAVSLLDGAAKSANPDSVRWRTSNPSVLNVSSTGLATAGNGMGEAVISADITINSSVRPVSREIVVVPDGTYRVVGTVTENQSPFPAIAGARVEVLPDGPSTTTDFGGQYRLYGVPPSAQIQVSSNNYSPDLRSLSLTGHSIQNFQLALTGVRASLVGNYTLSIDADTCGSFSPLPTDLRHRSYLASVSQNGLNVDVALIESRFVITSDKGNHFSGQLVSGGVRFFLDYFSLYDYYFYYYSPVYPSVAERVSNNNVLVPSGSAFLTGSASGFTGTLNGSVTLWDSKFPGSNTKFLGSCFTNVSFKLTPR